MSYQVDYVSHGNIKPVANLNAKVKRLVKKIKKVEEKPEYNFFPKNAPDALEIKDIINDSNLTNSEFAEKIDVPKSSISHLLSERNNPSLDLVSKISSCFDDISTDYLIFGTEKSLKTNINESNELFPNQDEETSEYSVKDSNNSLKSIILIYENNKFEQIDKL